MNKTFVLLAAGGLALLSLAGKGVAQEEAVMVHSVNFPAADAAWSVTFQAEEIPGQASPLKPKVKQRQKIFIVRKGNLRNDVLTWTDGSMTNYWWSQSAGVVLYQEGADGKILAMKAGNMGDYRFDASLFSWVSKDTFQGMATFQTRKCRCYSRNIVLTNLQPVTQRVWIDDKTLRPVGWTESELLFVFAFDLPLPPDPLVLPAAYQGELKRIQSFTLGPNRL